MELEALREAVDALVAIDLRSNNDAAACEFVIALRRELDRLECVAARAVAVVHERGLGLTDGAVSTTAWLQWKTGERYADARKVLDAGRVLDELPVLDRAWSAGALSTSAANLIVAGRRDSFAPEYAAIVPGLVALGEARAYRELDTAIRKYRVCCDAFEDRPIEDVHGITLSETTDAWVLNGTLEPYAGAVVEEALEAATPPPVDDDLRTPRCRRADALVRICEHYLATRDASTVEVGRPVAVSVLLDADGATIHSTHDHVLAPHVVERLLCDSAIGRVVLGAEGQPIDVGRTRRLATAAQRRAVLVRDRHCRYPGCDRPQKWCEIHHVIPWERGGATDLDNLMLLCTHHHHVVHRNGWPDGEALPRAA